MPPPPHGTRARYLHHQRHGEDACGPCKQANTEYTRSRRPTRTPAAAEHAVTILLYPAVSPAARLLLGNELDADGSPPYGWRREWLAEWDGVA
jgi:hypothetical protein